MIETMDTETVAAAQTDQVLGETGTKGDVLKRLIIVPAAVGCGVVTIKNGSAGSAITIYAAGANLVDLKPFVVEIDAICTATGGWRVTTGANVSVIAVGRFI